MIDNFYVLFRCFLYITYTWPPADSSGIPDTKQTEDSDVDVCVEMKKPDLFTMVHIKEELQELFGKPVDIVRLRKNMNPMLLKQIKRDGIYAWRRTNLHYFDIDESIVFDVVKNKLPGMLETINKMIEEL